MKLVLEEKFFEFTNDSIGIQQMLNIINEYINKEQKILEYAEINGFKIYDDITGFIKNNLNSIEEIKIKTQTRREWVTDSLNSMHTYLFNGLDEFKQLGDDFYGEIDKNLWDRFNQFLEGISWINSMLQTLREYIVEWHQNDDILELVQGINRQVKQLEEAIAIDDRVVIRDTIVYELIPSFQGIANEIEKLIDLGRNSIVH